MQHSLESARAFVTGAASGLGRAVAERIVYRGGRVVLLDTNHGQGGAVADRLGRQATFAALVEHLHANPMLNGTVVRLDGALRRPPHGTPRS